MNNRPLYINKHKKAVTPMNLMMGRDMVATENDENELIEWSKLTEIKTKQTIENFWNQWLHSYIPTLEKRKKWEKMVDTDKLENRIVLLMEETRNRRDWKYGKIIKPIIGHNGLIRSALIKTHTGFESTRPLNQIILIPTGGGLFRKTQKNKQ
jgi:Family of unknown function (DUF5641)